MFQSLGLIERPGQRGGTLKQRAYTLIRLAKRHGFLKVPDHCEECGGTPPRMRDGRSAIQAHHFRGYEHPLDVKWICYQCHREQTPKPFGERNARARLSEAMVREIRKATGSGSALARRFGVSKNTILRVKNGVAWAAVSLESATDEAAA